MRLLTIIIIILLGGGVIGVATSTYTVSETESAIVLQFGSPIRETNEVGNENPGLHFKLPWEEVIKFDKRNVEFDMRPQQLQAGDQERLEVDAFLRALRQSIAQNLPDGEVSVDAVASDLNVSRRTLQRRLADRGTQCSQTLQEVRLHLAERYLNDKRLSMAEIAFLLGYADQGSFSSAFKSWYGVSPTEFRMQK